MISLDDTLVTLRSSLFPPSTSSGHDPSKLFQRSVNKRNVPDYYDIIKEPMALSILKQKINKREYTKFSLFVRDCALVNQRPSFSSERLFL